jgi:hypothetical protein
MRLGEAQFSERRKRGGPTFPCRVCGIEKRRLMMTEHVSPRAIAASMNVAGCNCRSERESCRNSAGRSEAESVDFCNVSGRQPDGRDAAWLGAGLTLHAKVEPTPR